MYPPRPAILAQSAVRRLPRAVLWLLCLAYIVPGFVGRGPWRSTDINGFGTMWAMAQGQMSWWTAQGFETWGQLGFPAQPDALLPYWLGAGAIQGFSWLWPSLPADAAVRWPFAALLVLVLISTWYAVYGLARTPQAQPVLFAFGGEAQPVDYARAMADAGLLALLASLGLALLAHETAPALAQLAFTALSYCAVVQLMRGKRWAIWPLLVGLPALALSGAPTMALLLGAGSAVIAAWGQTLDAPAHSSPGYVDSAHAALQAHAARSALSPLSLTLWIALCTVLACLLTWGLDLWRWRIQPLSTDFQHYKGMARLLLWFGWPAMPLALWTVWRWRQLWHSPHLALPMWFLLVALLSGLTTPAGERSLLLGLPALATLAAFALPTLRRSVSALIDWFTLLFFSGWALVVWVVWFAMQTGIPAQPAANVARLAPGYVPELSVPGLVAAVLATLAWLALVRWRVGRHQAAIWKSLVLPAGGATLGWVLVMSLLIGPLNYALSNTRLVSQIKERTIDTGIAESACFEVRGLSTGLITALRYHGQLNVADRGSPCAWLLSAEPLIDDEVFDTSALPDEPVAVAITASDAAGATLPVSPLLPSEAKLWTPIGEAIYGPRGGEGVRVYRRKP